MLRLHTQQCFGQLANQADHTWPHLLVEVPGAELARLGSGRRLGFILPGWSWSGQLQVAKRLWDLHSLQSESWVKSVTGFVEVSRPKKLQWFRGSAFPCSKRLKGRDKAVHPPATDSALLDCRDTWLLVPRRRNAGATNGALCEAGSVIHIDGE